MKQKYSKTEAQQQKIKKEGKGFWKRPWLQVGRSQERVGLRQVWGIGSGPVLRGDGGRTQGSAELEGTSVVQGSGNRTPTGSPGSKLEGETVVPFPSNPIPGMFLLISAEPLTGWSSPECENPSPPAAASQEHQVCWRLCSSLLPSLTLLPPGTLQLEGASEGEGSGLRSQRASSGLSGQGKC